VIKVYGVEVCERRERALENDTWSIEKKKGDR